MTEVTEKMVEAALAVFDCRLDDTCKLRAAVEAALAAREPVNASEFVTELRGYTQSTCVCPNAKSADTIEEQADTIKIQAAVIDELVEVMKRIASISTTPIAEARALLARTETKL